MPNLDRNLVGNEIPILSEDTSERWTESTDPDAQNLVGFRSLGAGPLDLPPLTHDQMQRLGLALYRRNPYAHRIVKLIAAFAAGGTVKFEAEDPRVQKILTEHWNHPLNNWERNFHQCILELGIYGEVFLNATVMPGFGDVTWGQIDPLRVRAIKADDKDFARPAWALVSKNMTDMIGPSTGADPGNVDKLPIIGYDGRPKSQTRGYRVGNVLFANINGVRGALRGMSDLFPLSDYLDGLDQYMFALQQRVGHQNNWIWDVTLEGSSKQDIDRWVSELHGKPPKPGAVRAHNERVTWQAIAPNFAASESGEHVRVARNYILSGAGLADWIMGDMSSANRAATESSAAVVMKTMEQRQREAKLFLDDVFNFVIDQKILAGKLGRKGRGTKRLDRRFYITLPKIGIRDFQRVSNALRQGADGLATLVDRGLISNERAQRLAAELLSQLDLEGGDQYKEKDPDANPADVTPKQAPQSNQNVWGVPSGKDEKERSSRVGKS